MRGFLSVSRSMEQVIRRRRSLQNWRGHLFWCSVRREQWAGIDKKELVKDVIIIFFCQFLLLLVVNVVFGS